MRKSILAAVAFAAASAFPAGILAQNHHGTDHPAEAQPQGNGIDRETAMASWPEDRRTAYSTWTGPEKDYYWSLSEARQAIFAGLPPDQRAALVAMPAPDAEAAWQMAEKQAVAPKSDPPTDAATPLDPQPPQ